MQPSQPPASGGRHPFASSRRAALLSAPLPSGPVLWPEGLHISFRDSYLPLRVILMYTIMSPITVVTPL